MIYLGRQPGMKADVFMCTPNALYYSDKALFDELHFPKCSTEWFQGKVHGVTQLDEPPSIQPPHDLFDETTPGDIDNHPPKQPKGSSTPQPGEVEEAAPDAPQEQQTLPHDPDPVPRCWARTRQAPPTGEPPRRSTHKGKVPTLLNNVYGDKPPAKVVHDIESKCTWRKMIENQPGSFQDDNSHDQLVPGEFPEQAGDPPIA